MSSLHNVFFWLSWKLRNICMRNLSSMVPTTPNGQLALKCGPVVVLPWLGLGLVQFSQIQLLLVVPFGSNIPVSWTVTSSLVWLKHQLEPVQAHTNCKFEPFCFLHYSFCCINCCNISSRLHTYHSMNKVPTCINSRFKLENILGSGLYGMPFT